MQFPSRACQLEERGGFRGGRRCRSSSRSTCLRPSGVYDGGFRIAAFAKAATGAHGHPNSGSSLRDTHHRHLAPADIRKAGARLSCDFFALGVLAADDGVVEPGCCLTLMLLGELSLDGSINRFGECCLVAISARRSGKEAICPPRQRGRALVVEGLRCSS